MLDPSSGICFVAGAAEFYIETKRKACSPKQVSCGDAGEVAIDEFADAYCRSCPVFYGQLLEDALEMLLHRARAYLQDVRDLSV
jgi:hypothetical protein